MADVKETVQTFGPSRRLVGILTRPAEPEPRTDGLAMVILNAGIIHRTGPNRLHVRLARSIATGGTPTFRIDLPGIGDSGTLGSGGSAVEEAMAGIGAALDELERLGVASRFLVFGLCSGADLSFMAATVDPRISGIVLIDPNRIFATWKSRLIQVVRPAMRPTVWFRAMTGRYGLLRRLSQRLRPESAADAVESAGDGPAPAAGPSEGEIHDQVQAALQAFMDRGVQILYIITRHYRSEYVYRRQFHDAFPDIDLGDQVEVEIMPTAHHTFTRASSRELLQATVTRWVEATWAPAGRDNAGSTS